MKFGRMAAGLAIVAALGMGSTGEVAAQELPVQEPIEVTSEDLERFVEVYPAIVEVSQDAQARLATVSEPAEAQAIQAEANEAIMATLEGEEMSVQEYEQIVQALNTDAELLAEFEALMEERYGPVDG